MRKNLLLIVACCAIAGSIGCSSTPKQAEAEPALPEVASSEPPLIEQTVESSFYEEPEVPMATSEESNPLSLGTGSSGRGH